MSKTQKSKSSLPKGGIFFQGETEIKGDYVEYKEVHGNQIHGNQNIGGDNISIKGDGNIIGDRNVSQVTKAGAENKQLESYFVHLSTRVEAINRLSSRDRELITATLEELRKEVKKGDNADLDKVNPWLKMLKKTAPEIVGGLLETLVHPLVGRMVEVVAKAILKD